MWWRYAISHTNHSYINQFLVVISMKCIQNFVDEIQLHTDSLARSITLTHTMAYRVHDDAWHQNNIVNAQLNEI